MDALIAEPLDWRWVLDAAEYHRITPLIAGRLAALPAAAIPPDILQRLRTRFDENALRNVVLARHLVEILSALETARIPTIPIKGPALAISAYGDLSLRQAGDLDVVVPRGDLTRARAVLASLGFTPAVARAAGAEAALLGADYHVAFMRDDGLSLELHWALARRGWGSLRDVRWAWTQARRVQLLGREVRVLSPESQLVYLCAHASKHLWDNLRWVCDVAAVLRAAPGLNWLAAHDLARRSGTARMLALGMHLAQELLGTDTGFIQVDVDQHVRALARVVRERLWTNGSGASWPLRDVVAFQCGLRAGPADVVSYCVSLAASPQPSDVGIVALPRPLRALYYAVRPFRLMRKYARRPRRA